MTFKTSKYKITKVDEAGSSKGVKKTLFEFARAAPRDKTDATKKVNYTDAMKNLEQIGHFFQEREDYIDTIKEELSQLQTQNKELNDALKESSCKQENFVQLTVDLQEMRGRIDDMLHQKHEEIQDVKKQLHNAQLRTATVKQWIEEDKNRFVQELNILAENNVVLQTNCQVLQERLNLLKAVEEQIKAAVNR